MIGTLLGVLERALGERAPASVVVQHLDGLDAIMGSHFRFEERELVAVLDAADAGGSDLDDLWRAHDRGRVSSDERLAPGGGPVDR